MKAANSFGRESRWPPRVETPAQAVKYIDTAGYCMLFPVANVRLPSLYSAVARRDFTDGIHFDKHFERVWRWKDELPRQRRAFYAKYFRGKGTFISRGQLPYFLAMRDAVVAAGDHYRFYREGRIREDARLIWQALEQHGPLATLELRHACGLETTAGNVRFKRAILDLQCLLVVSHFGAEQETGAWASGRYELTCRLFPRETAAALDITASEAHAHLAAKFIERNSCDSPTQLMRLFGWSKTETLAAIHSAGIAPESRNGRGR